MSNSHVPNFNTPIIPSSRKETTYIDDSEIAEEFVKKTNKFADKNNTPLSQFHTSNTDDFRFRTAKTKSEFFDTESPKKCNSIVMDRPPVPHRAPNYYLPPRLHLESYNLRNEESYGSFEFPSIFCRDGKTDSNHGNLTGVNEDNTNSKKSTSRGHIFSTDNINANKDSQLCDFYCKKSSETNIIIDDYAFDFVEGTEQNPTEFEANDGRNPVKMDYFEKRKINTDQVFMKRTRKNSMNTSQIIDCENNQHSILNNAKDEDL